MKAWWQISACSSAPTSASNEDIRINGSVGECHELCRRIGKRIVNELEISSEQDFEWTVRDGGRDPTDDTVANSAQLLENLSKQTGLKFAPAEREVRELTIKRD